jgi:hypothetical protein
MKYLFFSILLFTACRNKTEDALLNSKLNEAIGQKKDDSAVFAQFKTENANLFKTFDSLTKTNQITAEQQKTLDSLKQAGIQLAMKVVKDQMKINDLKKEQ